MGKLIDATVNYDFWCGLSQYREERYNKGVQQQQKAPETQPHESTAKRKS